MNDDRSGRLGTNRLAKRLDQTLASPSRGHCSPFLLLLQLWSTFPILPVTPWLVAIAWLVERVILRKSKWETLGAPHDLDHYADGHHIHLTDAQMAQLPVIICLLFGFVLLTPDAFVLYALAVRRNCGAWEWTKH